jgi:hypothetical protein
VERSGQKNEKFMSDFAYILDLLEAKGWYLYEGIAHASLPQVISTGRARVLRPGVYYHLMPATAHDASVEEVRAAATEAARTNAMPTYNDGANKGRVDGVYISDGSFAFASRPDSFAFSLDSRTVIEDAIKFNLSNFNTFFFESIDEIGTFLRERGIAPQRPPVLPSQLRWTYAHSDRAPGLAVMFPENPGDVLFRGQGKRYLPCVSTAARGLGADAMLLNELNEAHQARLIANLIRTEWFVTLLRGTTAAKWLQENRILLDEMALAQHYGLPTGYIDLTQSFDVSAFFACCRYDSTVKKWTPVADGEGVIYAVLWRTVPDGYSIRPINLQFFPRPSEQWGWTCEQRLGDDFDKLPFVRKFIFKHDVAASRRVLAIFAQGNDLFPADPLSELADKIISSPVLPLDVAERIAGDVIGDPQGKPGSAVADILGLLQAGTGVRLSGNIAIADLERINGELDQVWVQKRDSFFTGIGFRLVRQRKE